MAVVRVALLMSIGLCVIHIHACSFETNRQSQIMTEECVSSLTQPSICRWKCSCLVLMDLLVQGCQGWVIHGLLPNCSGAKQTTEQNTSTAQSSGCPATFWRACFCALPLPSTEWAQKDFCLVAFFSLNCCIRQTAQRSRSCRKRSSALRCSWLCVRHASNECLNWHAHSIRNEHKTKLK